MKMKFKSFLRSSLISIACILTASALLKAESLEEDYFATRDGFIRRFANGASPSDERQALTELEGKIRAILGPLNIEGFSGQGKINLWTLRNEMGFGQVDGLRFNSGTEFLFVTTRSLLNPYLAGHPGLPRDIIGLSRTGDFYRRVFHADAGVTLYAEVPVKSANGKTFVRAFLGVAAQDIGPFIPNGIFVFVSTGRQIRIAYADPAVEIRDIPQCRSEWEAFNRKSAAAYEIYLSSRLKDNQAFDDFHRYEVQGFEAYCQCFGREAKDRPFFDSLKKQAQSIADLLQGTGEKTGEALKESYWIHDNGTVLDLRTNLMWRTNGYRSDLQTSGGPPPTWEAVLSWIGRLNREKASGFSDWRLPSIEEYSTIYEEGAGRELMEYRSPNPVMLDRLGYRPPIDGQRQLAWSSEGDEKNFFLYNFVTGDKSLCRRDADMTLIYEFDALAVRTAKESKN